MPDHDQLVLISAGHTNVNGQDRGAAGNGFVEGNEAVIIRDALASALRRSGMNVIEDGADGISEPLRKAIVLARKADTALEIHFNAGPASATGIEVLAKPNKKALAQKLAAAIHAATGIKLRGGDGGWKADSSGQHHRLAFCEAGGLIVEVCFISNASDMSLYKQNFDEMIERLAAELVPRKPAIPIRPVAVIDDDNIDLLGDQSPTAAQTGSAGPTIQDADPTDPAPSAAEPGAGPGSAPAPVAGDVPAPPATSAPAPDEVTKKTEVITAEGTKTVEVTSKNEQDVNIPAKIVEPEPYNKIGFFATIKRDLIAVTGGNIGFESLSTYAQQASGWPPWVVSILTKVAIIVLIAGAGYLGFRLVHFLVDTWKKNKRVTQEIDAKTAVDRKDIQWIAADGTTPVQNVITEEPPASDAPTPKSFLTGT